ncbi:SecY-interacting protein [Psychrosphaera haliotis]|uniref:SecY-interacting protein n=2 Tax=Psychrosphaera haliotis TaxID=555083 RepID=A0A6N8F919_9GAMM|nr:SecY-interacting protein [Psychrosphaera haliotis]
MPTIKSEGLMSKNSNLTPVLTEIIINWHEMAKERGYPALELDDDWPSPCAQSNSDGAFWQPVLQSGNTNSKKSFDNVGEAFELEINQQYSDLFTLYFSDNLNMKHEKGDFQLLQVWSDDDFERFQQNLVGHLLMKQKLKQKPTLFFALTEQDDLNLVVDNTSGEVCLEYVGKEPHETIANNLTEFLEKSELVF